MNLNARGALLFLVNVVFSVYIATLYLRILLQRLGADYYNPLIQFIARVTDPLVRPTRRIIRPVAGWDLASLLIAIALGFLNAWIVSKLYGLHLRPEYLVRYAGMKLIAVLINLYIFTIVIQALLSWFNPNQYNPLLVLLWRLNEPLLRPIRRIIPPIGGTLDIAPLIAVLLLCVFSVLLRLPGFL